MAYAGRGPLGDVDRREERLRVTEPGARDAFATSSRFVPVLKNMTRVPLQDSGNQMRHQRNLAEVPPWREPSVPPFHQGRRCRFVGFFPCCEGSARKSSSRIADVAIRDRPPDAVVSTTYRDLVLQG